MKKTAMVLAAVAALAMTGAAFGQGSTIGGPSAAGAPQPPTSNPDDAKFTGDQQNAGSPTNADRMKPRAAKREKSKGM